MNHIYRIVWNEALGSFVAVAEHETAHGKSRPGQAVRRRVRTTVRECFVAALSSLGGAVAVVLLLATGQAWAEPSGGQVTAGAAGIQQTGSTTVITQTTPKVAIQWQRFDIERGETVRFDQPSASAIALNRVIGTDGSRILGQLQANGQVFLINPNGILFGRGAQVDVGGLVASTLNLTDDDFLAGRFTFSGAGGSVRNEGRLNAVDGGSIALLGSQVSNTGEITADRGSAALAAGRRITLDFGGDGLLKLSVDEGTLNALVDNGGLVRADGGSVLLTARAADALRATVVNNTGLVQARTLENRAGVIKLLGGLDEASGGTVVVNGQLDASAPNGGDGGFIDASAYNVRVMGGTQATTLAPFGKTGEFLIDPSDFTITAGAGPQTSSSIGNTTLQTQLASTDVTLATTNAGADAGNLIVNGAVTWTTPRTLTLRSRFGAGGIQINQPISFANGGLTLDALRTITASAAVTGNVFLLSSGDWQQIGTSLPSFSASNFRIIGGGSFVRALGGDGSSGSPYQLTDVYGLQGMGSRSVNRSLLGSNFWIANDIDASVTASWNGGLGWAPVGSPSGSFTGSLDGNGRRVSGLTINRPTSEVGLFGIMGASSSLSNIRLEAVSVRGSTYVGAAAGYAEGATLDGVRVSGTVSHGSAVGGLVGYTNGSVTRSVNEASVTGFQHVGGIAGIMSGANVSLSYNTGTVTGTMSVGGVVGRQFGGVLERVFNTGEVVGPGGVVDRNFGGLVGQLENGGALRDAYSTGAVRNGGASVGGAVGAADGASSLQRVYSTGAVSGGANVGGLVGGSGGATVTASFWDTTTGQATSAGGTGKTTAELKTLATFTGAGWANIDDAGGTGLTWRIYGGNTMPLLRGFMTGLTLTPDYDGSGTLLANIGKVGLPSGANAALVFGTTSGTTLTLRGGTAEGYTAEADATGLYSVQLGYDLGRTASRRISTPGSAANDITLPNGVAWTSGTLAVDTTGAISATGAIAGGASSIFDLKAGNWRQVNSTLPGFAVRDFRLSGGTFVRALGGDGSTGTPYQLADVYGLQGMASAGLLASSFRIANNIDASGTASWNGGAGWKPVGDSTNAFAGILDGGGFSVSGLTIARPTVTNVGLIGRMDGTGRVADLGLTGVSVSGNVTVGGAVGQMDGGTVERVRVSGSVGGSNVVGGVVGSVAGGGLSGGVNEATVTASGIFVGGIAGILSGQVSSSYNTGVVTGSGAVGGIAGSVGGLLETSFNTGEVRATGNVHVGGLTGQLAGTGTVRDAYSTGAVVGGAARNVGGAIGVLATSTVTVDRIYSTGAVSGGTDVGGLIGRVAAGPVVVTNSFWNTETSGQATSALGVGKTTAELQTLSTFTGAGWANIDDAGGTVATWRIYGGHTAPLLRSFMTGLTVTPAYDGSGALMTNIGSASLPVGTNTSLVLGTPTVNTLTLSSSAAGGYTAAIDPTGLYSTQLGYDITAAERTISTPGSAAGDITLSNGVAWTNGTLAIATKGNITADGAIAGGTGSVFDLRSGTWQQVNSTLPDFAVKDFRLSGGRFVRAEAGDGSTGAPYEIVDAYGLQGLGSAGMLGLDYVLTRSVDAAGTADWNAGAGFKPIGTPAAPFTGALFASGTQLSGLTIDRPAEDDVGLFGSLGATAQVGVISMLGVSVSGRDRVGALAGSQAGSVGFVQVDGTVSGRNDVGGVFGVNEGDAQGLFSLAEVTGADNVGGLVGRHTGVLLRSSNFGTVSGLRQVGGVVGSNQGAVESVSNDGSVTAAAGRVGGVAGEMTAGSALENAFNEGTVTATTGSAAGGAVGASATGATIRNVFSTGAVSGVDAVGGLVGDHAGSLEDAYASGSVDGTDQVGGLVGLASGSVARTYSQGAVTGATQLGGLVGRSAGASVTASFWDAGTSGRSTSAGGTSKTTAELQTLSTFTGAGWDIDDAGATGKVWRIYAGRTAPLLRSFMDDLDLSADNLSRTYDATTATLNATLPGGGGVLGNGASGKNAGTYLTGYYSTQLGYDITQAVLTIDPAVVSLSGQRVYDASTAVAAGVLTPAGTVGGETLTLTGSGSVTTQGVGTAKPVGLGTLALGNGSGGSAGLASNYTLVGGTHTVDITAKAVTVSGLTANDKVYDATRTATLNTAGAQADGLIPGDAVSFSAAAATGSFADKNVGSGKAVTVSGAALSGAAAGNYSLSQPTGVTADISAKAVTVSGVTANDKVYDATRTATLNTVAAQALGLIPGDAVSFSAAAATGSFADKNVGTGKAVTVSGAALSGAAAGNYSLSQPTGLTADITAKSVTVSGITANDKVYDATLAATLNTVAAQADGLIPGDTVSFSAAGASGAFGDKNVGTGKAVTVSGTALSGAAAGNYTLTQPTGVTADITAKSVTVTGISADNKVYDATVAATLNTASAQADGLVPGDAVSFSAASATGAFGDKNVGTGKAVTVSGTALSGAAAGNYTLSQPTGVTADITAKSVTVTGITANDKVYDATVAATLNTAIAQADGLITGDAVSFSAAGATGAFADKNVGTGKAVTVSGTALSGAAAGNYTLSQPTGLTADITAKSVTVTGITANNKVYDATVAATLNTASAQADGLITGDAVSFSAAGASGAFGDKSVGIGKAVTVSGTALSGAAAGNYTLSRPTGVTADITAKAVTVSGITANDKVYDATVAATLNTAGAVGDGLIAGDAVSLEVGKAGGVFGDKNVGTGKAVTVSGTVLSGAAAGNYTLSQPTGVIADITAKSVTVTGITANDKVYDATVVATLNTAAGQADGLITGDAVSFSAAGATGAFGDKNVGSGKAVTVSGTALTGAAAGNYSLTQPTGVTADITSKSVTVSGITANHKVYDATVAATLNTASAQADGLITGDAVSLDAAGATGAFGDKNVGTGKAVTVSGTALSGAAAGNYTLTQPAGLTADITTKAVTVSGITANNKVYDATVAATLNTAAAQADGLITGDDVSLSAAGATGAFADKNVGTGKAVAVSGTALSGAAAGNYSLSQPTGVTADITAKSVTVTGITANNKVYDATVAATLNTLAAQADGLITGDAVSFSAAGATGSFGDKNVGSGRAVTVSGTALSGAAAGNYSLVQPTGVTADITSKSVTVSGITANNKVYDATVAATLNTASAQADGLITGDAVSLDAAGATGAFADKNVGAGKAVTVSGTALSGAAAGNYTLSQPTGVTADITAKAVTVSGITANDKVYDATVAATLNTAAAQADGLITGDEVSLSAAGATGAFGDKNVGTGKAVTVSGTALSGAAAGNYLLSQPTGVTADITAKAVAVTGITANNKVYDATVAASLNTAAAQADGLITGDAVSFSAAGATGAFGDKNVGTGKVVTVSGTALSGAAAGNYTLSQPTGVTAEITAKSVTVTGITANDKVYDATVAATLNTAAAQADGLITGDAVSLDAAGATGAFADKNVGTGKVVTVSGTTLSGAAAGNYTLTQPAGLTADITAKSVTVSGITANNKVYDATVAATLNTAAAQADGLITGDDVSLSAAGATGAFADKNVGTGKAVAVSGTALSGAAAGNYSLSQPTGVTADITAKSVTVTGITANNKVYDATVAATLNTLAAQADGLITGDAVSFSAAAAAGSFADKNVGTGKAVTVTGTALSGAAAGNYSLSQPTGITADITARSVTVNGITANNKVYDATLAATLNTAAAQADGLITGDAVSFTAAGATGSFADKNVGTGKAVTVSGTALSGAAAGNYTLTQPTDLTADITARSVTVSGITANHKVYDATVAATLNTAGAVGDGLIAGDEVSLALGQASGVFGDKNVGTGKAVTVSGAALSGAAAGNYTLSQPTGLAADITAKAVTVNGITANNKVYDATTAATLNTAAAQADGLITGDAVGFSTAGASGVFADKNVGTGKAVTVSGTALSGAAAGNYALSQPTGVTADITAKAVTVSGVTANNKVYDATAAATLNTAAAQADGLITGDAVSFGAAGATGAFADKNVGTGKAVTVSGTALSGAAAGNYALSQPTGVTADITARSVTVTGITANSKVYDATVTATLNTAAAQADGLIAGDDVSLNAAGATGSFADKNVGTGKAVTVSSAALSGAAAGNYLLSQPTGVTADITAKAVTVSGITADNKVYDATTAATLNTAGASAVGLIPGDEVSLDASAAFGRFADKDVGTDKPVSLSGTVLIGAAAGNYAPSLPGGLTADITPRPVTVTGITADNKVYDATVAATLNTAGASASGLIAGDEVGFDAAAATGSFADKNVGTAKPVTLAGSFLSGASAGNYRVGPAAPLTADITPRPVTVTGVTAQDKVYDATLAATLDMAAAVAAGLVPGDDARLGPGTGVASFADKNVGTAKPVTLSGLLLTGSAAGNYTLTLPSGLRADITARPVVVLGLGAIGRPYDGTTVALLTRQGLRADGLIGTDEVRLDASALSGSHADKNVGLAKPITLTGLRLEGGDAGNYRLLSPALSAEITPALLTAITANVVKLFGADDPLLTYRLVGEIGGDVASDFVSGALRRDAGEAAGLYPVRQGTLTSDNPNYTLVVTPSTLRILPLVIAGGPPQPGTPTAPETGTPAPAAPLSATLPVPLRDLAPTQERRRPAPPPESVAPLLRIRDGGVNMPLALLDR